MKYKTILLVTFVVFAVSLAVVVGKRLSAEAMAVIVGVVAGVAASIPTSLIVVWVALRARPGGAERAGEERRPETSEPRVVIVAPSPPPQPSPSTSGVYPYPPTYPGTLLAPTLPYPAGPRRFTVIGGEEEADA